MRMLAEDTHPDADQVLLKLLREASPARKMAMVLSANHTARANMLPWEEPQERRKEYQERSAPK